MESDNYYHYTNAGGCDYIDSLLIPIYGNLTEGSNSTLSAVKDTVTKAAKEVSTRFMDTLSTKEARAFIAGMVLFGLSVFIGVSFIGCLCVKKRRQRRRLKASKLLPSGSDNEFSRELSIQKRRSSVVSLVRSSTNTIKESVAAAAAATVSVVTKSSTRDEKVDDTTVKSDYNNMEDEIVGSGSYIAPESSPYEGEKLPIDETTEPDGESIAHVEIESVGSEPMGDSPTSEPLAQNESVTASEATEKTKGNRFVNKIDKHLMKKLSVKTLSKKI